MPSESWRYGDMTTMLSGRIRRSEIERHSKRAGGGALKLLKRPARLPTPLAHCAGQPLAIGIRPEHLRTAPIDAGNDPRAMATLKVKVDFTEHLGADCIVHARLENGATVALRLGGGARSIAAGSALSLCADPLDLHVFDRQSGQRI